MGSGKRATPQVNRFRVCSFGLTKNTDRGKLALFSRWVAGDLLRVLWRPPTTDGLFFAELNRAHGSWLEGTTYAYRTHKHTDHCRGRGNLLLPDRQICARWPSRELAQNSRGSHLPRCNSAATIASARRWVVLDIPGAWRDCGPLMSLPARRNARTVSFSVRGLFCCLR